MNTTIEHQNVEFKESWHDKYLEWICGYANASGGVLYIGRDDNGKVVGVDDAKGLLELIPSKITNTMGIVADVNLQNENGRDVIEISVDKYPFPISYYGRYYYRSGSTMRLITGKELDRLLLKQYGKTWDGMVVPKLTVEKLDSAALAYFRTKAVDNERLTREDIEVPDEVLMENLKITDEDGAYPAQRCWHLRQIRKSGWPAHISKLDALAIQILICCIRMKYMVLYFFKLIRPSILYTRNI